jgi:hypothetical protein
MLAMVFTDSSILFVKFISQLVILLLILDWYSSLSILSHLIRLAIVLSIGFVAAVLVLILPLIVMKIG